MRPRPSFRSCRNLQPPSTLSRDSTWISDGLLANAFNRYLFVSNKLQRSHSSVPGPLESRRRLGKRRIGDLNFSLSPGALPPWAIPDAVDRSQWRWEPPAHEPNKTTNWLGRKPSWGRASLPWGLDKILPGIEDETAGLTRRANNPPSKSTLEELRILPSPRRREMLEDVAPKFKKICRRLESEVMLGEIDVQELAESLPQVWQALNVRVEAACDRWGLHFALLSAIVTGIRESRVQAAARFPDNFWKGYMAQLATLPANDDTLRLFELTMGLLPIRLHDVLREEIASVISPILYSWTRADESNSTLAADRMRTAFAAHEDFFRAVDQDWSLLTIEETEKAYLCAEGAHRACHSAVVAAQDALSSHQRQIQALSRLLSRADPRWRLIADLNNMVLNIRLPPEQFLRLRCNWLAVLFRCPRLGHEFLRKLCFQLLSPLRSEPALKRLAGIEICQLIMRFWAARGYLTSPNQFEFFFNTAHDGNDLMSFAALAYTVHMVEGKRDGLIIWLCKFLKAFDRLDQLPSSFERLGSDIQLPVSLLQRVAVDCRDHRLALELHKAYVNCIDDPDRPQWNPSMWLPYLDAMFADPTFSPAQWWKLLDVEFIEDRGDIVWRGQQPRESCSFGTETADLVAQLAPRFASAANLNNRIAFRHVSQCVLFWVKYKKRLPSEVLLALYRVITKDLDRGLHGKLFRLEWLIKTIEQHVDPEEAAECSFHLRRWQHLASTSGTLHKPFAMQ